MTKYFLQASCILFALVRKMAEDRGKEFEPFADDLFRYLLPRRIGVEDSRPLRRDKDLPSPFHPHIGMSVLCECYRRQCQFIQTFVDHNLSIEDMKEGEKSFARFYTRHAHALYRNTEDVIFKRFISVASLLLELSVFYHLRGNQAAKYYAGALFFLTLKDFFTHEFYENGGWEAFLSYVSGDVKTYAVNQFEVEITFARSEFRTEWLRNYDLWVALLYLQKGNDQTEATQCNSCNPEASHSENESLSEGNGDQITLSKSDNSVSSETASLSPEAQQDAQPRIERDVTIIEHHQVVSSCRRDGNAPKNTVVFKRGRKAWRKRIRILSPIPEVSLTENSNVLSDSEIIDLQTGADILPADIRQELTDVDDHVADLQSNVAETDPTIGVLMSSRTFRCLALEISENPQHMIQDIDILQIEKLILKGNEIMAAYCLDAIQHIDECRNKRKSVSQPNFSKTGAIPKKRITCKSPSPHVIYKRLLDEFLCVLLDNEDSLSQEASEIFYSVDNAEILLNDDIFRNIMQLMVNNPEDRLESEWIISIAKSLINALKPIEDTATLVQPTDSQRATDISLSQISAHCSTSEANDLVEAVFSSQKGDSTSISEPSSTSPSKLFFDAYFDSLRENDDSIGETNELLSYMPEHRRNVHFTWISNEIPHSDPNVSEHVKNYEKIEPLALSGRFLKYVSLATFINLGDTSTASSSSDTECEILNADQTKYDCAKPEKEGGDMNSSKNSLTKTNTKGKKQERKKRNKRKNYFSKNKSKTTDEEVNVSHASNIAAAATKLTPTSKKKTKKKYMRICAGFLTSKVKKSTWVTSVYSSQLDNPEIISNKPNNVKNPSSINSETEDATHAAPTKQSNFCKSGVRLRSLDLQEAKRDIFAIFGDQYSDSEEELNTASENDLTSCVKDKLHSLIFGVESVEPNMVQSFSDNIQKAMSKVNLNEDITDVKPEEYKSLNDSLATSDESSKLIACSVSKSIESTSTAEKEKISTEADSVPQDDSLDLISFEACSEITNDFDTKIIPDAKQHSHEKSSFESSNKNFELSLEFSNEDNLPLELMKETAETIDDLNADTSFEGDIANRKTNLSKKLKLFTESESEISCSKDKNLVQNPSVARQSTFVSHHSEYTEGKLESSVSFSPRSYSEASPLGVSKAEESSSDKTVQLSVCKPDVVTTKDKIPEKVQIFSDTIASTSLPHPSKNNEDNPDVYVSPRKSSETSVVREVTSEECRSSSFLGKIVNEAEESSSLKTVLLPGSKSDVVMMKDKTPEKVLIFSDTLASTSFPHPSENNKDNPHVYVSSRNQKSSETSVVEVVTSKECRSSEVPRLATSKTSNDLMKDKPTVQIQNFSNVESNIPVSQFTGDNLRISASLPPQDINSKISFEKEEKQETKLSKVEHTICSSNESSKGNVKDESLIQNTCNVEAGMSVLTPDCVMNPEETILPSAIVEEQEDFEEHSLLIQNTSSEIRTAYENSYELLAETAYEASSMEISSEASEWIFKEMVENDPDLVDLMQIKLAVDKNVKSGLRKHYDRYIKKM